MWPRKAWRERVRRAALSTLMVLLVVVSAAAAGEDSTVKSPLSLEQLYRVLSGRWTGPCDTRLLIQRDGSLELLDADDAVITEGRLETVFWAPSNESDPTHLQTAFVVYLVLGEKSGYVSGVFLAGEGDPAEFRLAAARHPLAALLIKHCGYALHEQLCFMGKIY